MGRKARDKISDLGIGGDKGGTGSVSKTNNINSSSSDNSNNKEIETKITPNVNESLNDHPSPNAQATALEGKEVVEVDLGLDISTAVTGVVLLNHATGALIKMDHIKLNIAKLTNLFEKADYAIKWIQDNIGSKYHVNRIFVEANAKGFSAGFSSADTLFTLAKMNVLISYLSHKHLNAPVIDINVTSARSRIGYKDNRSIKRPVKEKVREFVLLAYPSLPISKHIAKTGKSKGKEIMDKECEDEVDAFVIAKGGQLIHNMSS